jgi:2-deoxy-D-gluconate 3-dehydrogenase
MKLNELFDLSGKTALVTGCSRGIGKAMATGLAAAGADIIGISSSLESGSEIEKEIVTLGKNFLSIKSILKTGMSC